MTQQQIEEKYNVKCEKMKNNYAGDRDFWAVKDVQTDMEIGRCATLNDVAETLSIIKAT